MKNLPRSIVVVCTSLSLFSCVSDAALSFGQSPVLLLQNGIRAIHPNQLVLKDLVGSGGFGEVHWATLLQDDGSVVEVVTKCAKPHVPHVDFYLDTEAHVNRRLASNDGKCACPYIAPYLGECTLDGKRHLVWRKSGTWTLEECIDNNNNDEGGLQRLVKALDLVGASRHDVARIILRQMLTAISYIHSVGVVHRDIKPGSWLVDEESHCLRLIDFGGTCDLSSWLQRKGYRGKERGVRTLLYCPPEEFIELQHPFAFDVYSTAMTWLKVIIGGLRRSEDAFFQWRMDIRNERHDLEAWHEGAVLRNNNNDLPDEWEDFFACAQGREGWRLVKEMLRYDPAKRITATDALLGPYLNPNCSQDIKPEPPPVPWSLTSHLEAMLMAHNKKECVLSDAFFGLTYQVQVPAANVGMEFSDKGQRSGVLVASMEEKANEELKESVLVGDQLLEIGPIDVEDADAHHVYKILEAWPRPTVRLLFRRASW